MPNPPLATGMNLILPTIGGDDGYWGNVQNSPTLFEKINDHDHTPGNGNPIPISAVDIDGDVDLDGNNLINVRSTRYNNQSAPLAGAEDERITYVADNELYYNDAAGNKVKITDNGSLNAALISPRYLNGLAVSSNFTILSTDVYNLYLADTTSAAVIITLPQASTMDPWRMYFFKDAAGTTETNSLTLARQGSDTIDGATSYVAKKTYGMWFLVSDGVNKWFAGTYSNKQMNDGNFIANGSGLTFTATSQTITFSSGNNLVASVPAIVKTGSLAITPTTDLTLNPGNNLVLSPTQDVNITPGDDFNVTAGDDVSIAASTGGALNLSNTGNATLQANGVGAVVTLDSGGNTIINAGTQLQVNAANGEVHNVLRYELNTTSASGIDITTTNSGDITATVSGEVFFDAVDRIKLESNANVEFEGGADVNTTAADDIYQTAGDNIVVDAGGSVTTTVGDDFNVTADDDISLIAGNGSGASLNLGNSNTATIQATTLALTGSALITGGPVFQDLSVFQTHTTMMGALTWLSDGRLTFRPLMAPNLNTTISPRTSDFVIAQSGTLSTDRTYTMDTSDTFSGDFIFFFNYSSFIMTPTGGGFPAAIVSPNRARLYMKVSSSWLSIAYFTLS